MKKKPPLRFSLDSPSSRASRSGGRRGSARSATSAGKKSKPAKATGSPPGGSSTPGARKPPAKRPPKRPAAEVVAEFVRKASASAYDVLVGIDPGTTGAIGFKCGPHHCAVDIPRTETVRPKVKRTTRKERRATGRKSKTVMATNRAPDYPGIVALFGLLAPMKARVRVMLEQIPVTMGPGRKYAELLLNRAYAMWPLFLVAQGFDFHEQKPSIWKAEFNLLGKDKAVSLTRARKLFPAAELGLAMHVDRAEALLLAEYLRRKLAGKLTT